MDFTFVSGNPALDLAGTVGSRRDGPVDLLAVPSDLERWVAECPGLPGSVAVDAAAFEGALSLREAIYQLALDRMNGRRLDSGSLDIVNQAAARPPLVVALGDAGIRVSGDLAAVLSHLARSGIAMLGDPQACLKECGRAGCTRVYLDRSRGARRTWCGMDECGNRVKAAAYRARMRAATNTR
ncbi:ABATE domain-containing protein [Phytoactinopolyspora mesophila]|uniref:Zinc finger CGNR domain-containing protein n=1 Tax=Phytoactinopolyspora mesophila TaxID=2650750 RepID=A0A7K3MF41_9ACTN|nr:hypothetical protein [Phytoactinopolyspora mesophila]